MPVVGTPPSLFAVIALMQSSDKSLGFSLMEMMIVLAVVALLAFMAVPSLTPKVTRAQIAESLELIKGMKEQIALTYRINKAFPATNKDANIPRPELLLGNFVQRIEMEAGAFHITFGNKSHKALKDRVLSIRPLIVEGSPESPISWICGQGKEPDGMRAIGVNKTSVENQYLPLSCF